MHRRHFALIVSCLGVLLIGTLMIISPRAAAAPGEGGQNPDAPRPGAQVLGDGLIVPGQRIGPVRLGMSINQIITAVGSNPKRDEFKSDGIILYEWRSQGLWVSQTTSTKAIRVISAFGTSDKYRTEKGVSLLMTRSKMEAAYGKGYKAYDYPEDKITLIRYAELGLQFGLVNQPGNPTIHDRIFQIGIFKSGTDLPLLKQPAK